MNIIFRQARNDTLEEEVEGSENMMSEPLICTM